LRTQSIKICSNAIIKGSGGGIKLQNVKGQKSCEESNSDNLSYDNQMLQHGVGQRDGVVIKANYVWEIAEGVGIVIDASTVCIE
jgi:hypothetical protein